MESNLIAFNEKKISRETELADVLDTFLSRKVNAVDSSLFDSYREFYNQTWRFRDGDLHDIGSTHICFVVNKIKAKGSTITRPALRKWLQEQSPDQPIAFQRYSESKLNQIINLSLQLWLVMDFCIDESESSQTIKWNDSKTLYETLRSQFPEPRIALDAHERINRMTMVRLHKYNAIKIEWTDDIRDHLKLNLERRVLQIFNMKWYMYLLNVKQELVPKKIIQDYILTMNLLFPSGDDPTMAKYEELALEGPTASADPIYLGDLTYWRDEITTLWVEYKAPPPSMSQLFYDRRNVLQWYTFLFAFAVLVLTIVFGTISSVLTGLQTGYSYESLKLAREAAASPSTCPP